MPCTESETELFNIFTITTALFEEKSYILQDKKTQNVIAIDPGDAHQVIEEKLLELSQPLDYILLTHGHFDHIFSAHNLSTRFGAKCLLHPGDKKLVNRASLFSIRFSKKLTETPKNIEFIDAPSSFEWSSHTVRVLPCPGHTPGGVSFVIGDVVFTGDTLFFEKIGPTNYAESDKDQLKKSVALLIESAPESTLILPGHGRPWHIAAARNWWELNSENPAQFTIIG